jgi:hypothetical protein
MVSISWYDSVARVCNLSNAKCWLKQVSVGACVSASYEERLETQFIQYKSGAEIHALPEIFHYWSNKYLRPRLENVFDIVSARDFYATPFARQIDSSFEQVKFVSIGSGDCSLEIEIVEHLLSTGYRNFSLVCLELSESLIREGRESTQKRSLESYLSISKFDANRESFEGRVHGFMANYSLHHIVELERLFAMIDNCLSPTGCFLTMDMIGRNGHMRWPETLRFVDALWDVIDENKKFNHQLNQHYRKFENYDCSSEGFEGIRAQDIMPLLVSKFSFTQFLAVGGIIDIFIDRSYGPNYDVNSPTDTQFIDFVEGLNSDLINLGFIKPTMLYAAMAKKSAGIKPRTIGNLTPEFCVRDLSDTLRNSEGSVVV